MDLIKRWYKIYKPFYIKEKKEIKTNEKLIEQLLNYQLNRYIDSVHAYIGINKTIYGNYSININYHIGGTISGYGKTLKEALKDTIKELNKAIKEEK